MEIVENLAAWQENFNATWLATYERTGEADWKQYVRPKNQQAPAGPGVDLARSRLLLVSSAGAYVPQSQPPFDTESVLGDYGVRLFPATTRFDQLAYAHTHYDHAAVNADPQVLLPLYHLADMVDEGVIGELAPQVVSFGGYQPDVGRVVTETIPLVLAAARQQQADAALLVPA